jgi:hypothetical protein
VLGILHTCHDTNTTHPTAQMRCIQGRLRCCSPQQPTCMSLLCIWYM